MLEINIRSAIALDSAQKKQIEAGVQKKYPKEKLQFVYQVKKELIAGISISVGGVDLEDQAKQITIQSAMALDSAQKKQIEAGVQKKYPKEKLQFVYQVKKELIAGMSMSISGKLYDASLKARLQQLVKKI